jgi:Tol biopolymer transport system component
MMNMVISRTFVSCVLVAWVVFLTPVCGWAGDPLLEYKTIETEHFRIHFQKELEPAARSLASIAEEVHEDLTIEFGWEVDGPTYLILDDTSDSSQGISSVLFRPVIHLYVTGPDIGSEFQDYDNWLRTLFIHEYTHTVSLRIHSGLSRIVNGIFGDVYLPNTYSPVWFREGITVLNETHHTTAGRIRSERYNTALRTAALEDGLVSLGQISNEFREYPRGSATYIYGAMFFEYLYNRFGMQKISQIYHDYGSSTIPFGFNRVFKRVFGSDLITLYKEWQVKVRREAEETRKSLEAEGLTSSKPLTWDGESKGRPVFSPDGKSVVIAIGNGIHRSGIFQVPMDGSPRKRLALSGSLTPLSFDRAGRLFYTRSAPFRSYYRFKDVFALDGPGSDPRRVTYGMRARGAAISPRGDLMVMTVNDAGTTKLVLADERGHFIRTLVDSKPGDQTYVPSWSPDGKKVAVRVRQEPQVDIAVVDIRTGAIDFITDDRAIEHAPSFSPTGRYLLYASDRTGISNIYAWDFEEDRLWQVTNVLTGAYSPSVSHDGKVLAFVKYSRRGYDLHVMPFDIATAREPALYAMDRETPKPLPEPSEAQVTQYNPLPGLRPHYWMFNTSINGGTDAVFQAVTALSDLLGRHNLGVELDYDVKQESLGFWGGYSYTGLVPGFHVGVSHRLRPRDSGYTNLGVEQSWVQEITRGSLKMSVPIMGVDRSHKLSFGYALTHARPREAPRVELDPRYERPTIPKQYFRAGLELGWSYSDLVSSPLGISPHKGRSMGVSIELYDPVLGGNQSLVTFRYGWTEYIRVPWFAYHVVALRLNGGIHVSHPPGQASFSVGSYGSQNIVDSILNNTQAGTPTLRGYLPGSLSGDQFHSLRVSYRFPIWFAEAAYATLPFYLKRVQAGIFTDNVLISPDPLDRDDWYSSVGAELVWHITLGYFQNMTLRTGYAHGFMENGGHEIILGLLGGF